MIRDKRTDRQYLLDIQDAVNNITEFLKNSSQEELESNYQLQLAIMKLFEIIGEAVSRITPKITDQFPEVNWKEIAGMRHRLVHDYFEISIDVMWNAAQNDIPRLKEQIKRVLDQL